MAASTPVIRARNAQYQSSVGRRGSAHVDRKTMKPSVNPYIVGFILVMLSGSAIFQVLKLAGIVGDVDIEQ
ncbi:hypothetical protein BGZ76_010009 [Entomortierella beljakovae]|nr:hypothetical protein BGZ76_010009 [Entomortierella beljakovae]